MTLAIETSCDDTSVAIIEKETQNGRPVARLHFHEKVTSDNAEFRGVHPLVSLQSHQRNLANLVSRAIQSLPSKRLPHFVSVTRGPGMRSNLFTGLDTAKGLAVAWQIPLVGVHHMQAHALTPRMVSALHSQYSLHDSDHLAPSFPFLSLLASGGHTLLIHSASLTQHRILGATTDIAIGECLDKIARVILPVEVLKTMKSTMYGALLEDFAFPPTLSQSEVSRHEESILEATAHSAKEYIEQYGHRYDWYRVPANHELAKRRNMTKWGWSIDPPLTKAGGGTKISSFEMSFSGLTTRVERIMRCGMDPVTRKLNKAERANADITNEERQDLAKHTMRACFEHITSRLILGLQSLSRPDAGPAVVMAGGVAANSFLRHILASTLVANGFPGVQLHFPPPRFCTDNAAMIGWAGIEMYENGHTDPLTIRAQRRWPLDRLEISEEDG
ncbi:Mitochondrial tRNAs modification protein [Coniothyrium glycines]